MTKKTKIMRNFGNFLDMIKKMDTTKKTVSEIYKFFGHE